MKKSTSFKSPEQPHDRCLGKHTSTALLGHSDALVQAAWLRTDPQVLGTKPKCNPCSKAGRVTRHEGRATGAPQERLPHTAERLWRC